MKRPGTLAAVAMLTSAAGLLGSTARADDSSSATPTAAPAAAASTELRIAPPPSGHAYIPSGVALAAETVVSSGAICSLVANCIFGSGGGLVVRVGWRPNDNFFIGGIYEVSKQDPDQLYRLGILQQLRAEGRRYFTTGREVTPFF